MYIFEHFLKFYFKNLFHVVLVTGHFAKKNEKYTCIFGSNKTFVNRNKDTVSRDSSLNLFSAKIIFTFINLADTNHSRSRRSLRE